MRSDLFTKALNLFVIWGLFVFVTGREVPNVNATNLGEVSYKNFFDLSLSCNQHNQAARRVTYRREDYQEWNWEGFKFVTKTRYLLLLDDSVPSLSTDDVFAKAAHVWAGKADAFFRDLAYLGIGDWDGCYGADSETAIMQSIVYSGIDHAYSLGKWDDNSKNGFPKEIGGSGVIYGDNFVTREVIAHEWTHNIVNRELGLWAQGPEMCGESCLPGQSGALYEGFADIFSVLITGNYKLASIDRTIRDFENPIIDHIAHYALPEISKDCPTKNADLCKYQNAGIISKAAYLLMMEPGTTITHPKSPLVFYGKTYLGVPVTGIGRDKVAKIFFHAITSGKFIQKINRITSEGNYTFSEAALGIEAACKNLVDNRLGQITDNDCKQVHNAFLAVGMIPEPIVINATPTENLNGWDSFWKGVGQSITNAWEDMQHNLSSWWNDLQQNVKDWAVQQWESLQKSIEAQVNQWLQEVAKTVQSLCGAAMLPGGAAVILGVMRRHRR